MFLENLTLLEFLAILGAVSGLVLALYLLDRSKRKLEVSTLRFWAAAQQIPDRRHRKRIQQPWSLLLQLLGLLLLLLAMAQIKWGSRAAAVREHVLILDASAWMEARGRRGTLMDEARAQSLAYLRSLPPSDRVMLVRAEAFPTPLTGMEKNREVLEAAIRGVQPGSAALDLAGALSFARRMRTLTASNSGEIVFAGAGRHAGGDSLPELGGAFRILAVEEPEENLGLRKVALRRSTKEAGLWEVFVSARNYGPAPRTVTLAAQFGHAPVASRVLTLVPGNEQSVTFPLRTQAAGWLEIRLLSQDAFPRDNRVVMEVPENRPLRVAVYTRDATLLRPLLASNPRLAPRFFEPAAWTPKPDADVMVIDAFAPPSPPSLPCIWIDPPETGSPVQIRRRIKDAPLSRWRSEHSLGQGLRTADLRLDSASIFQAAPGDIVVGETPEGPAILARPSQPKLVVLGFHPLRSAMRYELATPLLFANMFQWLSPESFRLWEMDAGAAGSRVLSLDGEVAAADVKVVDENGRRLPFTLHGSTLRFFSATPGTVRVYTPSGEIVQSLSLPEVPEKKFEVPRNARRGVPRSWPAGAVARDLWQILALLGGAVLLLEWLLFGQPLKPAWRIRLGRLRRAA
jgi:hypothetical protein